MTYKTRTDADLVSDGASRQNFRSRAAAFHFQGRQERRQKRRAGVALDPAVAVVDVERVLGEAVGQRGADGRDALAGNQDGRLIPGQLLAGDTGHDVPDGRAPSGDESPHEIQQPALRLMPRRHRQIVPSERHGEIEHSLGALGPA
jgi:hypothetical protein